jgi:hypothetical protein
MCSRLCIPMFSCGTGAIIPQVELTFVVSRLAASLHSTHITLKTNVMPGMRKHCGQRKESRGGVLAAIVSLSVSLAAGRPVLVPQERDVPLEARAHDGYRHMTRPAEAAHRHAGPRPPFKGAGGACTPMWSPVVEVKPAQPSPAQHRIAQHSCPIQHSAAQRSPPQHHPVRHWPAQRSPPALLIHNQDTSATLDALRFAPAPVPPPSCPDIPLSR